MGVRLIRIRRLEEKNLGLEFGGGWCLSACCVYIFVLCRVVFGKDKKAGERMARDRFGRGANELYHEGFLSSVFCFWLGMCEVLG